MYSPILISNVENLQTTCGTYVLILYDWKHVIERFIAMHVAMKTYIKKIINMCYNGIDHWTMYSHYIKRPEFDCLHVWPIWSLEVEKNPYVLLQLLHLNFSFHLKWQSSWFASTNCRLLEETFPSWIEQSKLFVELNLAPTIGPYTSVNR